MAFYYELQLWSITLAWHICFDFTVELLVLILILKQNVIADEVLVNMALAFSKYLCVLGKPHSSRGLLYNLTLCHNAITIILKKLIWIDIVGYQGFI